MREFTKVIAPFFTLSLYALSPLKEAEDLRDIQAPVLEEMLLSENPIQRAELARTLGRIQKPEGLEALLKLLNDTNAKVKKEAVFALGQLGWEKGFSGGQENEIADALQKLSTNKDSELRTSSIEAIGKLGLNDTPQRLLGKLEDSSETVRAETLLALYRYRLVQRLRDPNANPALLSDDEIKKILKLESDSSSQVKRNLAYYFWRVSDPRGVPTLLKLSKSKDLWTRYFAVSSFAKYSDPSFTEILNEASSDESYHVRVAAVNTAISLGLIKDLNPALRGDPSYHVRVAYVQALSKTAPDADAQSKLEGLSQDPKTAVRAEALKALSKFPETFEMLRRAQDNSSWVVRAAVASAATEYSNTEQKTLLEKALSDSDVRVRVSALEALSTTENEYAFQAIEKALNSDELSERGTAITTLSSRKEETRMLLAFNCYQRSSDEKWVEMREEIVKLWASVVSEETNNYLRTATQDTSASVASLAIKTLEERGISVTSNMPEKKMSFSPYRELTFKRNPKLTLKTTKGEITLELFHKEAPIHVANIVGFAQEKKYDGLPFHRVVSNFVIQGGDPDKSGWGSAGYSLRAEINRRPFIRGALGMPRSTGFDTGGIQLFINHIPTPHLDGQYTVFGHVIDGLDVVDQIEVGDLILSTHIER